MKKINFLITIFASNIIYSECSDLDYDLCLTYSQYCEWSEDSGQCFEIGGGGGGGNGNANGPYDFSTISETQGLRNGPDYRDGVVYYPINAVAPYKSIVLTPGFGGGSSYMSTWAEFFASHGFIAMRIGPNDEINDSHFQRGEGLIDGIESIRQENTRVGSPLYGLVDTENFSVSGYSMGGGASQNAALMDNSIKAVISLNPTVLFEDCNLCPSDSYEGEVYCICLVPELIEHYIPTLIFAGEIELNELEAYAGLLGQDIYANLPLETEKILFEGAGSGHGTAESPYGEVADYALAFMNYFVLGDQSSCEQLLVNPSTTSQYLTNINCQDIVQGDVNSDTIVNVQDIVLLVNLVMSNSYENAADLNQDGIVNVLDIVQVVNLILN